MPLFPWATGQIPGTPTNDNAVAGNIGELISSNIAFASRITLTTNTPADVTSIILTPGDWEVTGWIIYEVGATTSLDTLECSCNITSATISGQAQRVSRNCFGGSLVLSASVAKSPTVVNGAHRESVSVNTTIYLVANALFGVAACKAYGYIEARRVR